MTLKELRKRAGLTQQELAKQVEMSRSTIGQYETYKCGASSEVLMKLAHVLKVDFNTMMHAFTPPAPEPPPPAVGEPAVTYSTSTLPPDVAGEALRLLESIQFNMAAVTESQSKLTALLLRVLGA